MDDLIQYAKDIGVGVLWPADLEDTSGANFAEDINAYWSWSTPQMSEEEVLRDVNELLLISVSFGLMIVLRYKADRSGPWVDYDHPSIKGRTGKIVNGELIIRDNNVEEFRSDLQRELEIKKGLILDYEVSNRIRDFLKRSKSASVELASQF